MLYYDEYGNKENHTILLLHRAGALDTFCGQYCLANQYHLVVPHLAGAGKAATKIYEPEKTVKELFALIDPCTKDELAQSVTLREVILRYCLSADSLNDLPLLYFECVGKP